MNQKQIHVPVLAVDLSHALATLAVRRVGAAARGQDLGRDEDVFARDAGLADRLADFGLVLVELRRVDVAVAGAEGRQARLDALAAVRSVDAETEARDLDGAVGEGEEVGEGHFSGGGHGGGLGGLWLLGLEGVGEDFVVRVDVSVWSMGLSFCSMA